MANSLSYQEKADEILANIDEIVALDPDLETSGLKTSWTREYQSIPKGKVDQEGSSSFKSLTDTLYKILELYRLTRAFGAVPSGIEATPTTIGTEGVAPSKLAEYKPEEFQEYTNLRYKLHSLGEGESEEKKAFLRKYGARYEELERGLGLGGPPGQPPIQPPSGGAPPTPLGGTPPLPPPPTGGTPPGGAPPPPPGGPPPPIDDDDEEDEEEEKEERRRRRRIRRRARELAEEMTPSAGMSFIRGMMGIEDEVSPTRMGELRARAEAGDPLAIAELSRGRGEQVAAIGGELKGAATSTRVGELGGHVMGAVAGAATLLGQPEVAIVAEFGKAVFEAIDKLRDWGKALHDANMQFAEFSGAMAGVQARQEVRDIELGMERGERRAPIAEYLAQGRTQLERAITPWEDVIANLQAGIVGGISEDLATILEIFSPLAEGLNRWLGRQVGGTEEESKDLSGVFTRLAEFDKKFDVHGRPKRF